MAQEKERADELVFLQGLAESREQAKRLIMAGNVVIQGQNDIVSKVDKPGHKYSSQTVFTLTGIERFVSRGAYKLLTALEFFQIDVKDCICLDAGASTGGFTDCLLQHEAAKVYAIDVGRGQLHHKIYSNKKVVSIEGVNLRIAPEDLLPELVDIIVADVSFISLTQVLPSCVRWLKPLGSIIALVKPQFETWPCKTDKGIVKDQGLQQKAVDKVVEFCQKNLEVTFLSVVPSAIKGAKGNQEYLICLKKV